MRRFTVGAAAAGLVAIFTVAARAQQPQPPARPSAAGAATAQPAAIPVKITDKTGKAITLASLPPDAQAKVERVRRAAESLRAPAAGGGAQALTIDITCTWSPLQCTITISW